LDATDIVEREIMLFIGKPMGRSIMISNGHCCIENGCRREVTICCSKIDEEGGHHSVKFAFGATVVHDSIRYCSQIQAGPRVNAFSTRFVAVGV